VVATGSLACEADCRHPCAAWCNLTPHCHCPVLRIKHGCLLFLVQHGHRLRGNGQRMKGHCTLNGGLSAGAGKADQTDLMLSQHRLASTVSTTHFTSHV